MIQLPATTFMHHQLVGAAFAALLLAVVAAAAILVFEILMFVDVLRNDYLSDGEKLLWAAGMLLVHPFVALAYYFVASSKRKHLIDQP